MSIMSQFRLDGRNALVTGSSRGIGRAIALGLAECGAAVAVHAINNTPVLQETLAEVKSLSPRSVPVTGNLATPGVAARLVHEAGAAMGSVDILVVNASLNERTAWREIDQAEAESIMQVNFLASLTMIQAAVPGMQARKWGRILTIGSVQQQRPHPQMAVYAASKSALENLCRNLAKQIGPDGITINNLAPGVITTDRNVTALADIEYASRLKAVIPLRSFGEAIDCAGTALLLCSDAGRYITGADFFVDGGLRLP